MDEYGTIADEDFTSKRRPARPKLSTSLSNWAIAGHTVPVNICHQQSPRSATYRYEVDHHNRKQSKPPVWSFNPLGLWIKTQKHRIVWSIALLIDQFEITHASTFFLHMRYGVKLNH